MGSAFDFIPFVLMLAVLYVLVIQPQAKERKAREDLVASLTKDDEVVTEGGMHGKVVTVKEATVVLEIGKGVHVTLDKSAVARRASQPAPSAS